MSADFERIQLTYNAEGSEALSPLDVDWLIGEVVRLRSSVAFLETVVDGFSDTLAGTSNGETET